MNSGVVMNNLIEISKVTLAEAEARGILKWSIWEKEVGDFIWYYEVTELSYILEGDIEVTPDGGETFHIVPGDLVVFKAGLSCKWRVNKPVKKHYSF